MIASTIRHPRYYEEKIEIIWLKKGQIDPKLLRTINKIILAIVLYRTKRNAKWSVEAEN